MQFRSHCTPKFDGFVLSWASFSSAKICSLQKERKREGEIEKIIHQSEFQLDISIPVCRQSQWGQPINLP